MKVVQFIIENWDLILLVVAAVAALGYSIYNGNKSVVMNMLFSLVTEAEKEYGAGTGALKLAAVITKVYPQLPPIVKAFVSADQLKKWVEEALVLAKTKWGTNSALAAYICNGKTE